MAMPGEALVGSSQQQKFYRRLFSYGTSFRCTDLLIRTSAITQPLRIQMLPGHRWSPQEDPGRGIEKVPGDRSQKIS